MFKLTNTKKCKERTVATAFEAFAWAASASVDCKLKELEPKLTEEPPYFTGKEGFEKVKFSEGKAEEFRKNFLIWVSYMNPKIYARYDDYFYKAKERMDTIYENRLNFFEHFNTMNPPD